MRTITGESDMGKHDQLDPDSLAPCPRCGHRDYYVRGRHATCRPCNAAAQRRYRERQLLGQTRESTGTPPRPLSASLTALDPAVATRRRTQTHCRRRHALSGSNVHWQTDALGRVHRVCRTCHRDRQRARYGMPQPAGRLAELIMEAR